MKKGWAGYVRLPIRQQAEVQQGLQTALVSSLHVEELFCQSKE